MASQERRLKIELAPRTLAYGVLAVAAVWLAIHLWPIAITLIAALLFTGTLSPGVSALERRGVRRSHAIAVLFGAVIAGAAVVALLVGPPLWRQLLTFLAAAPKLQAHVADLLSQHRITEALSGPVRHFAPSSLLNINKLDALTYSTAAAAFFGYFATSVVLALYFLADRDRMRGALFSVVPKRHHVRLAHVLLKLETIVGGYVRGQLITSLLIAVFTFGLLSICRVDGALALAALAGLTDAIPLVGGLLATVPAALAALALGPGTAAIVGGALLAYQELESRVIVPRVYGKALRLPGAGVVIALLVGGKLLGILGALLALPIAATLRMLVYELRVELPGTDAPDPRVVAVDEQEHELYVKAARGRGPDEAAAVAVAIASHEPMLDPKPVVRRSHRRTAERR